jgi:hypothetical protein
MWATVYISANFIEQLLVSLTIIRYPKKYIAFALLQMALFRFPLFINKKISFYKLLGSGKNGTFDKHPDWQQWGILTVQQSGEIPVIENDTDLVKKLHGSFISEWIKFFKCEIWTILLEPIEGHGKWNDKEPFGPLEKNTAYNGPIATLTRATIRLSKLNAFWKNVDGVASQMRDAKGFITSLGIGEMPYIKQATFSIWENKDSMKQFAYQMHEHTAVIKKTRQENWYSEELFVRFRPIKTYGTIKGNDPLKGKL